MNAWPYFKQHFRSSLKTIIIITALCLMLCMLFTATFQVQKHVGIESGHVSYTYHPTLGMSVFVLCVMSILAPILQFSTFKRRKNLDMWYALPISRRNIGLVHYVTGFLMVLIPFTACFLQNILLLIINGAASHLYLPPLIPFYFLAVFAGFIMYSVYCFAFNQANAVVDGVINIVLWTFILPMVCFCFAVFSGNNRLFDLLDITIATPVFSPVICITNAAENTMRAAYGTDLADYFRDMLNPRGVGFIINTLAGIGAAIGQLLIFGKRPTEQAQEVSDSYFCYRVIIPTYAISAMLGTIGFLRIIGTVGNEVGSAIIRAIIGYIIGYSFTGFISVMAFIGYIVYRRGFHFKLSDGIVLAALGAFATMLPMLV